MVKSPKQIQDTPKKNSWSDTMPEFKTELREKADNYRSNHESN